MLPSSNSIITFAVRVANYKSSEASAVFTCVT